MKRLFLLSLAVLALAPALRAQDQITVETKFIETSIAVTPPLDDAALGRMKDADLLSAPRVTTKSGQRATVEIIHEQALPAGEIATQDTVKPGVSIEVTAQLQADGIAYRLRLTKCELANAAVQPAGVVETVSRDVYATGMAKSGEPVWLRLASSKKGRQILVQVRLTQGQF